MKNTTSKHTNPIDSKEKVESSNDEHIDQDFKGYPHDHATENIIKPKTKEDKLTAKTETPNKKDNRGKASAKANDKKPGEADSVEKSLSNTLGSEEKKSGQPNTANKVRKEKKS